MQEFTPPFTMRKLSLRLADAASLPLLPSSAPRSVLASPLPTLRLRHRHLVRKAIRNLSGNPQENQLSGQEFFEAFLKERRYTSDFVSRASDSLWRREILNTDDEALNDVKTRVAELQKIKEKEDSDGFLKLTRAKQWELGMDGAPTNTRSVQNGMTSFQDDWRRAGFLEYEALKRELLLLTSIVAVCGTLYCGFFLSLEGFLSYGIGALGSLIYLKVLYLHVDELSEEDVPDVFFRKRSKRIGIRSSDLQDSLEKTFFGSGIALRSPRLLIPVALYLLWAAVHRSNEFELEIAPLMFGFFAYKAALLVQAYRDNKELDMEFEKDVK